MIEQKIKKFRELIGKYNLPVPTLSEKEITGAKLTKLIKNHNTVICVFDNGKALYISSESYTIDHSREEYISFHDLNSVGYYEDYLGSLSDLAYDEYCDFIEPLEDLQIEERDRSEFERLKKKYNWQ